MLLGKIIGKTSTQRFEFYVETETKKFEYITVNHPSYNKVLCQIIELEKTAAHITAKCNIIGYKDDQGKIAQIRIPFDIGSEVLKAEEYFIKEIITIESKNKLAAYLGNLDGSAIPVYLDLNKLLTKHIAVLAKSGSGKSYSVGVLLEEMIERKVPLIIIDPHGEYSSLKDPNSNKEDIARLQKLNLKPKGYSNRIEEYGDPELKNDIKPILLNEHLTTEELLQIFPTKLSNAQLAIIYTAIKDMVDVTVDSLILEMHKIDNNLKWNIINVLEYLKSLKIFSTNPTPFNELIQPGKCSIINLKGIAPEIQEIIVYKLLKDLFIERKKDKIPPFFAVIEEAHNFVPEKGFSEAKSAHVLKTIASEGRKFGLGLCIISQRPAIVQKTVLSQCTTQIILKITNPNDLKAVAASVEGITMETESEIKNLQIGTALVTGIVDLPLFVNIRPRKTKHGGTAVAIVKEDGENFFEDLKEFREKEILPLIGLIIKKEDILAKYKGRKSSQISQNLETQTNPQINPVVNLIPCFLFLCSEERNKQKIEYTILVEMIHGEVVTNYISFDDKQKKTLLSSAALPELDKLSKNELLILEAAFHLKEFNRIHLISKVGVNFEIDKTIEKLLSMQYLEKVNDILYKVSERYILSQLSKYSYQQKIEFKELDYDKKLEKCKNVDKIKERLSKFTEIKNLRECWLVRYEIN
ncbi:ATP-binding protein [Candidatus Woesearchaeota archaeon]|nr:ATP-binding protein [Candidatus Woesearchaeota archaeon]